ncbi:uncharacterized protein LOC108193052 isoform X2 [Daucus carota subsp. sativus]|nr:PREDICTED: uncharacterized protein LOC108193052 isoform X2 [Daucus carota subsp. sativus]
MLIRSSLSSSTEAALSLTSDHGEQELIRDWTAGAGSLQESPGCKHTRGGLKRSVQDMEREENCTGFINYLSSSSQHSTVGTMSETSLITFVYKRRKLRDGSSYYFPDQSSEKEKPGRSFFAEISCEVPSVSGIEHKTSMLEEETEADRAPVVLSMECSREPLLSKSTAEGQCSQAEELGSIENPKSDKLKNVEACHVNDRCSSSQLKTDLCATMSEPKVADTGECSSSDALVMDGLQDTISEKDVIASMCKVLGIDKAVWPNKSRASSKGLDINSTCICSLSCKVCDQSEMTLKMVICDQCEEASHLSCCNPPIKKIPRNQWFCHSCLKKRYKALKEISRESHKRKTDMSRYRNGTSRSALGPIARMLKDNEPYTTSVRVGPEFQAEVPDCCGPVAKEIDNIGNISQQLENYPSVGGSSQEGNLGKNRHISICNWLQCRQVKDGEDVAGTVCGKWRRAPLFEPQTDNWECFDSFLWDPTHADCAVPQELDTEQVMKDLKYIEMLRPRLAAKKHKVDRTKSSNRRGPMKGVRHAGAL